MKTLDDKDSLEANGTSVLEISLFTISTESRDGRRSDVKREILGVFHAVSGANGRFKTSQIIDVGEKCIYVYNTIMEGMIVSNCLGPADCEVRCVDRIRA